jgi:hypothetical protein
MGISFASVVSRGRSAPRPDNEQQPSGDTSPHPPLSTPRSRPACPRTVPVSRFSRWATGRSATAETRVRLGAAEDESAGYDVMSFDTEGLQLHIEAKATTRSPNEWDAFWLTENEVNTAEADERWQLWRIWNVDSEPHHEDRGNIVTTPHAKWTRSVESWKVRRKHGDPPAG